MTSCRIADMINGQPRVLCQFPIFIYSNKISNEFHVRWSVYTNDNTWPPRKYIENPEESSTLTYLFLFSLLSWFLRLTFRNESYVDLILSLDTELLSTAYKKVQNKDKPCANCSAKKCRETVKNKDRNVLSASDHQCGSPYAAGSVISINFR